MQLKICNLLAVYWWWKQQPRLSGANESSYAASWSVCEITGTEELPTKSDCLQDLYILWSKTYLRLPRIAELRMERSAYILLTELLLQLSCYL
jgi:hypothetical protein